MTQTLWNILSDGHIQNLPMRNEPTAAHLELVHTRRVTHYKKVLQDLSLRRLVSLLSSFMEDHCRLNTSTADIGIAFSQRIKHFASALSIIQLRHSQRINRHFTSVLSITQHAPFTAHQALRQCSVNNSTCAIHSASTDTSRVFCQ